MKTLSPSRSRLLALLLCLSAPFALQAQVENSEVHRSDTLPVVRNLMNWNDTTYANSAGGEFSPGRGFNLVKSPYGSLNLSFYGMARYLNQLPGEQTWQDHLGRDRKLVGRNDFFWHRAMIWFTGFVGTPKLTYAITVWSVMTTQQSLVYGNLQYKVNDKLGFGIGIFPNLTVRSMHVFPYFSSTDRTMAEEALRGGFTNGMWAKGELLPRFHYVLFVGNNLSTLGVQASKLTRNLATSATVYWMPTTGEFGPRQGHGDLEHHNELATRFGLSVCHSREDRFNNTGEPSPDNTQIRMSDGVLFFERGALADSVTIDNADYDFLSFDFGLKYKGFGLHTEVSQRILSDFKADGELPFSKLTDYGYTFQPSYMFIKRKLNVYGVLSGVMDEFERNPFEVGGGVNFYPLGSRNFRINTQVMHVEKSPAGGTFGLYAAGQTGTTVTVGFDIIL